MQPGEEPRRQDPYVTEENYEETEIAFETAIETEPIADIFSIYQEILDPIYYGIISQ